MEFSVEVSIFRAGPGSGRVENFFVIRPKNTTHDHPLDASGLNFRVGLGSGLGLGGPPAHFIV
jgi:hypothetical protein